MCVHYVDSIRQNSPSIDGVVDLNNIFIIEEFVTPFDTFTLVDNFTAIH